MRFPGLAISLAALAAIVLLAYSDAQNRSFATSPPSAERFSIDMDPAGVPANTATSLGSLESCASIIENNILDADEDFVDTAEFDVTVTGIPASNAMTGYTYSLSYPDLSTSIVYHQPMLIGPPIIIVNNSEPVPDTESPFYVSVLDPSGQAESGSGVLDRLRIQTNSVIVGVFPLALSNAAHIDTDGNAWAPDAIDGAIIEVNTGGCSLIVDIEMVSLGLTSVNPVPIGVDTTVTVDESIRNNSPYPVNTDAQTTFTVPSGCTVNGLSGTVLLNAALGVMSPGATVNHHETPALRCTALGSYQMPVTACGQIDDVAAVDLNSANNCQTQNLDFDVVAPPGTDADGDGVWDLDEFDCGVSTFGVSLRPEFINGFDDDGDGQTDEALPTGSESRDCDGDGYKGAAEAHVFGASGRDQQDCGTSNWPADFISDAPSTDRVTLPDLASFVAPVRHFNTNPGDEGYDVRWDLVEGGTPYAINLSDLASLVVVKPAKFGGERAFDGLACGQIGCSNEVWCTKPITPAGVALRLETDQLVYHAGELVQMSLIATNTSGSDVTLNIPWGPCASFNVVSAAYLEPCFCPIFEGCVALLQPGESRIFSVTWTQVNTSGQTVARGDYQIIASFEEDSCSMFSCWVPTTPGASHEIRLVP